jgi:hypothetical protein
MRGPLSRSGRSLGVNSGVVPLAQPAGSLAGLASALRDRTGKRPQKDAGACQWHQSHACDLRPPGTLEFAPKRRREHKRATFHNLALFARARV